jgi:hypothetical protein
MSREKSWLFLNFLLEIRIIFICRSDADVAELVDAQVSEACWHSARDGSIPFIRISLFYN